MIPWVWVVVAAWAGGVTLGLLNAVGVHTVAGSSRFAPSFYFSVFAWPIATPFFILAAYTKRDLLSPDARRTFRYLADVDEEREKPEPTYVIGAFKVCEPCRAVLGEPYEHAAPPVACDACLARLRAWQDGEAAKYRNRVARLCEPCRKGLGIELPSERQQG